MSSKKKISERFQIFKDEKYVEEIKKALESLGYEDDYDFYIQEIYRFEYDFEARGYAIGLEDEEEDLSWDAWETVEYEDVIHTDRTLVGYAITNTDNESLDIDQIMKMAQKKELRTDCCSVCGKRLVVKSHDARKEKDGVKCFDHRGIKSKRIEPETEIKEKPKIPLPVRNKPIPPLPPPAPNLKPQLTLMKFIHSVPKSKQMDYIR